MSNVYRRVIVYNPRSTGVQTIPGLQNSADDCTVTLTSGETGTFVDRAAGTMSFNPELQIFRDTRITAEQSTQWPDGGGTLQNTPHPINNHEVQMIHENKAEFVQVYKHIDTIPRHATLNGTTLEFYHTNSGDKVFEVDLSNLEEEEVTSLSINAADKKLEAKNMDGGILASVDISSLMNSEIDLSEYTKTSELEAKITELGFTKDGGGDLTGYLKESDLDTKVGDLGYVKADITKYTETSQLDTYITGLGYAKGNLSEFTKTTELEKFVADAGFTKFGQEDINFDAFTKTSELEAKITEFGFIKDAEAVDLSPYLLKDDINTEVGKAGYQKESDVATKVESYGYLEKSKLDEEVAALEYAKKSDIPTGANLSEYVKKEDLVSEASTAGFVKTEDVITKDTLIDEETQKIDKGILPAEALFSMSNEDVVAIIHQDNADRFINPVKVHKANNKDGWVTIDGNLEMRITKNEETVEFQYRDGYGAASHGFVAVDYTVYRWQKKWHVLDHAVLKSGHYFGRIFSADWWGNNREFQVNDEIIGTVKISNAPSNGNVKIYDFKIRMRTDSGKNEAEVGKGKRYDYQVTIHGKELADQGV